MDPEILPQGSPVPQRAPRWRPPLTKRQIRAAQLCAEDKLTDQEIANEAKCSRSTLMTWKHHNPKFMELMDKIKRDYESRVMTTGMALLFKRVEFRNDIIEKAQKKMKEQAKYCTEMQQLGYVIPGAGTGLVMVEPAIAEGEQVMIPVLDAKGNAAVDAETKQPVKKPMFRRIEDQFSTRLVRDFMLDQAEDLGQVKRDRAVEKPPSKDRLGEIFGSLRAILPAGPLMDAEDEAELAATAAREAEEVGSER
jgi:hypothetical protein